MLHILFILGFIGNLFSMEQDLNPKSEIENYSSLGPKKDLDNAECNIIPILQNTKIKTLKQFASNQIIKNLALIKKRDQRQIAINQLFVKLPKDQHDPFFDLISENLEVNKNKKFWYICQRRAFDMSFKGFNNSIKISPCGNFVSFFTHYSNQFKCIFINLNTHKKYWEFDYWGYGRWQYVFSPCGKFLAVASGHKLTIFENETGMHIVSFMCNNDPRIAAECIWSPCGKFILMRYHDNPKELVLWDIESGDAKSFTHKYIPNLIQFSDDSEYLLTTQFDDYENIDIWHCKTAKHLYKLQIPETGSVKCLSFIYNNNYIVAVYNSVSRSNSSKVLVYDIQDLRKAPEILKEFQSQVSLVRFNSKANLFVIEFKDKRDEVLLLNLKGQEITINHIAYEFIRLCPSGKILLTTKGKKAILWDTETGKKVFTFKLKKLITGVSFDSDEKIAFSHKNDIVMIPTPEGILKKKMKTSEGLEKILHLTRTKPENLKKESKLEA